jgi:hypothetical protein
VTRGTPLVRRPVVAVVVAVVVVPPVDLRRGILEGERGGAIAPVEAVDGTGAVTGLRDNRRRFGGMFSVWLPGADRDSRNKTNARRVRNIMTTSIGPTLRLGPDMEKPLIPGEMQRSRFREP